MKIDLPLETWTDVFGFVPRPQLAKLVPNFDDGRDANIHGFFKNRKRKRPGRKKWSTILDRQFVSFVQFYLNKCGQITLGKLDITKSANGNCRVINYQAYPYGPNLPLADVPMPTNIKEFREICLRCFDHTVSRFLEEFRRNSLLTNVNINLYSVMCNSNALFTFLHDILPLITSINSVNLNMLQCRAAMGLFKTDYSKLAKPMFRSARVLICKSAVLTKLSPRFLEEFRRNSLLTNVNINLYSVMCNSNALFTFLHDILPLITSINLVNLNMLQCRAAMGLFKTESSKLAKPMFRSARVLICNCFDQTVSRFLEEFRRNSLLTNVNINLYSVMCNSNALFTFLHDILPLITSINLVNLNMLQCRAAMGLFKTESSNLAKPMFQSARVLICNHDSHDYNWYCKWLYTQRDDGKPRILVLMNLMTRSYPAFLSFIEHLKKLHPISSCRSSSAKVGSANVASRMKRHLCKSINMNEIMRDANPQSLILRPISFCLFFA